MTDRKTEIVIRGRTQRDYAIDLINKLSPDKIWAVTVSPYRKKRSLDQNALIHSWFAIIARETGNDPDDVKEALKSMFLPPRYVEMEGKTVEVRRATSKLDTKDMAEFCSRVQAWAAQEFGIVLPTRDDFRVAA